MPTVLMIAYNFPPHGGAGVQRTTKFVKYLPQFGWNPIVVAGEHSASGVVDRSLLDDIPADTIVKRINSFDFNTVFDLAAKYKVRKVAAAINVLLALPDRFLWWSYKARPHIETVIKQYQPDIIYTTSGPYSAHFVGGWAKKRFNLPWVADFRDPWADSPWMPRPPLHKWINRRMEQTVIRNASKIITVSKPWLDDMHQLAPEQSARKFHVITNGYDHTDIKAEPLQHDGKFRIVHIGTPRFRQLVDRFVCAICSLTDEGTIPLDAIELQVIGKDSQRYLPHNDSRFVAHPYMPHKGLQNIRKDASVLLLLMDTSPKNLGLHRGKLFEYLAANRPILAVVPPKGVAEQTITATETGIAIQDDDEQIKAAIYRMYTQWKAGNPQWQPNWREIRKYTRQNLTKVLSGVMDQCVSRCGNEKQSADWLDSIYDANSYSTELAVDNLHDV